MKNFLAIIILLVGGYVAVEAQQIHQLTQYTTNDFVFNPAIAGKSHDLVMKLNYRKQWAGGFGDEAPSTFAVTAHTNFTESKSVGLGLTIYSDVTGPTRRGGGILSYAYHLPFDDGNKHLSFGLGAALQRNTLNYDKLNAYHENDNVLITGTESKMSMDFNFGTYYYTDKLFIGASIAQILGSGIKFTEYAVDNDENNLKLARHLYASAGYRFDFNDDFALEPMVLMKAVKAAPVQFDITGRFLYQKQYWIGLTYRTQDAVSILVGIELNNGINLAYSYDFTTSAVKNVSNGTHEITLGYDLTWRSNKKTTKVKDQATDY